MFKNKGKTRVNLQFGLVGWLEAGCPVVDKKKLYDCCLVFGILMERIMLLPFLEWYL